MRRADVAKLEVGAIIHRPDTKTRKCVHYHVVGPLAGDTLVVKPGHAKDCLCRRCAKEDRTNPILPFVGKMVPTGALYERNARRETWGDKELRAAHAGFTEIDKDAACLEFWAGRAPVVQPSRVAKGMGRTKRQKGRLGDGPGPKWEHYSDGGRAQRLEGAEDARGRIAASDADLQENARLAAEEAEQTALSVPAKEGEVLGEDHTIRVSKNGHSRGPQPLDLGVPGDEKPWLALPFDQLVARLLLQGWEYVQIEEAGRRGGIAMYRARLQGRTNRGELMRAAMIAPTIPEAAFRAGQRLGRHFMPNPGGFGDVPGAGEAPSMEDLLEEALRQLDQRDAEIAELKAGASAD